MKRIQDWSTSRRFVYFVQAATGEIKIGLAIDVKKRLRELQIGCPIDLQLILAIPGTFRTEQHVHRLLAASRVRSNSEWFFPTDEVHQFLMERGAGENWFVQS